MPKASPIQSDFSQGEISPLYYGRTDSDRYKKSLATLLNMYPTVQGGAVKRSGTQYIASTASNGKARLVSFEFSTTQAYVLEFGVGYIRFYKDSAQILLSGSPYTISSPYAIGDLFQLRFTQSADTLYIVHPSYPPMKLTRTGHTAWTLTQIGFLDGPYLPTNTAPVTLAPNVASGTVSVIASAPTFSAADVGRVLRIGNGTIWGWGTIVGWTSQTNVTVTTYAGFPSTAATTIWRMGLYGGANGYPSSVTFHEDRLILAGCPAYPQRFDGSNSSDYENFAPSAVSGPISNSNAYGFSLNANDVNAIRWCVSDEKGLCIGTTGGEWVVRPSINTEALSATNVSAKRASSYGSANVQPVQSGRATIFVQRATRKVREFSYFYDVDGFRANDLTILAEHITQSGIVQIAFQKEPIALIWMVRTDGVLAAMTYERESDVLKAGWCRVQIGGSSDAIGTPAIVESVASVPDPTGQRDQLYVLVRRYINGQTVRYVETITPIFTDTIAATNAIFSDCSLTYDSAVNISSISKANPAVFTTATSHGLTTGDKVHIDNCVGFASLNGHTYTATTTGSTTFTLVNETGAVVNTAALADVYVGGGQARFLAGTISGLGHIEGEMVSILADGAVMPAQRVTGGAVTLQNRSGIVTVGLPYKAQLKTLRFDSGAADGTAQGKTRRTNRIGLMLNRSSGLSYGPSFTQLDVETFRRSSDPAGKPPALFTGIITLNVPFDYDFDNQLCLESNQPLPLTVLAVMPQMTTQDR